MFGRYASSQPPEFIARLFRTVNALPNVAPSWNIAPSQSAMVVRRHPETGERHLDPLQWGVVPHWSKDPPKTKHPINARAETVATSRDVPRRLCAASVPGGGGRVPRIEGHRRRQTALCDRPP
jgi:putative SOS response-associated peptidase YedK